MSAKVLVVVNEAGEIIRNDTGDTIYQIIDEPHRGRRGTLAELTALAGPLQDETEAKFLFVLEETGEITGARGSVGVMTPFGTIETRNMEEVFQEMLREQQPEIAFLRDLLKADSLDELFGPDEAEE
ncbi:MAG: hypothetical protein Kow0031_30990 [Anaerolineae bacterium]